MQGSALYCKQITCSWRTWSCKDQWYQWLWGTVSRFIILQLVAWQRHSEKVIKQAVPPSFSCFDHRQFSVFQLQCGLVPEFSSPTSGGNEWCHDPCHQPPCTATDDSSLYLLSPSLHLAPLRLRRLCNRSVLSRSSIDLCFSLLSLNHHLLEFLFVESSKKL